MTNLSDTLAALKPCPFCGGDGRIAERPASGKDTGFFCAISCFCGGYSARAHQHAIAETEEAARTEAIAAWNTRTGQLVPVPSVERVALALINHDLRKLDLPMVESLDDLRFEADKREEIARATAVIAAMQEGRDG